ncbi:MAG: hypothetical protein RLY65_1265, partial [Pseudomonadota bacterium]
MTISQSRRHLLGALPLLKHGAHAPFA